MATFGSAKGLEPYSLPFCFLVIPRSYFRDTLLLGYASTELHFLLRSALLAAAPDCVQRERALSSRLLRIKLRGRPFSRSLASQRLLTAVLRVFYHAQWGLRASVNLRAPPRRGCVLFFERIAAGPAPSPALLSGLLFGALGLARADRLLLSGLAALPPFAELIRAVVDATWPPGLARAARLPCGAVRLVLRGRPWASARAESRDLLLGLIRALAAASVRVYAASRPAPGPGRAGAADTIFVARVPFPCALGDTFLLGAHGDGGLHLIDAPAPVAALLRQCARAVWPDAGVEEEEAADGAYRTIELPHAPWRGGAPALAARMLLVRLFEELRALGWRLHATFRLGAAGPGALSCFCFERCLPMAHAYVALSLGRAARLRLINAAPGLVEDVRREISMCWPKAVRGVGEFEGFPELALRLPLERSESVLSRLLFAMQQWGWRLAAAAELTAAEPRRRSNGGPDGRGRAAAGDLNTLFFERRIELALPLALPPPPPTLAGSMSSVR